MVERHGDRVIGDGVATKGREMQIGGSIGRPCVKRWLVYEGGKLSVVCLDYNGSPHMTIIDGARFGNQVSRNMMYALDLELQEKSDVGSKCRRETGQNAGDVDPHISRIC